MEPQKIPQMNTFEFQRTSIGDKSRIVDFQFLSDFRGAVLRLTEGE